MENVIEFKEYENKDKYIVLNKDNINDVLSNIKIESIVLNNCDYLDSGKDLYKFSYNSIDFPFVVEKDNNSKLRINPDYYLKNNKECKELLKNIIKNNKSSNLDIYDLGLINDEIIDTITKNKYLKSVSLCKYMDRAYELKMEDYLKFKKANIKVDTDSVCDKLKNVFDDVIVFNTKKDLIGFNNYKDLTEGSFIKIKNALTDDEIEYFKYINDNAKITFDMDDYNKIFKYISVLRKIKKNNKIIIKIKDKNLFNDYIINNLVDYTNIELETKNFESINLKDYINFEKTLYQMIEPAKNLSPFEKYIYAYNITKMFKLYKENDKNLFSARYLYSILINEYMVCVGYKNLLLDLLNKLNIPCMELSVDIDSSYDRIDIKEENINDNKIVNKNGHARVYVNLKDPKYNIDGFYVSDPTWDNDLEKDYYNHMLMTDNESTSTRRYTWSNEFDIFNINDINDYYALINNEYNKSDYYNFINYFKNILEKIKVLDIDSYSLLKEKYNYIDSDLNNWPDSITDIVYDVGNYILNHVNKQLSGKTIFEGIKTVYLNSYGYNYDNIDETLENVRKYNMERQEKAFPKRKKVNNDNSEEVIINDNNKFDFTINNSIKL